MSEDKRKAAIVKLSSLATNAQQVQEEHHRRHDAPSDAIVEAARELIANGAHTNQDIVILRGMISARSYEKTPYHEAIVPVLQEALDVLEGLTSAK